MTATAIPETPDQLEEAFHDDGRLENLFAEGSFGEFSRRYLAAFNSKNAEDVKAFKDQMQADLQGFMRDQADRNGGVPRPGAGVPAKGRSARRARAVARSRIQNADEVFARQFLYSESAPGAAEDVDNSEYAANLGRFVYATLKGEAVARRDANPELLDKLQSLKGNLAQSLRVFNAGMSERVPGEGGFLVPETLRSDILSLALEDGVMRPDATVIPMDSLWVSLPSIDDTSHVDGVFGGVQGFWTAEGASIKASAPDFARVRMIAAKLTAFTQIPNELLQDSSVAMDVWFRTFFPQAVTFFEDLAFLAGSGVNEPEGLINCPGAVTVTPAATGQISLGDVLAMFCRLWPPSLKRARWVCSPDALAQLLGLGLVSNGTALSPPALLGGMQAIEAPMGSAGDGVNYRLMGLPLRVSEKIPYPDASAADDSKAGALTLYDPSGYLIGDRQAMQVASSTEYSFANDEVSYRITERLDGRGWQRTPLQPANGSPNALSQIVRLGQYKPASG